MSTSQCFIRDLNRMNNVTDGSDAKPPVAKGKVMSYEEKSVGSTAFFKCEACPYMALAEDDIKFHLFTEHPELAKSNGLADHIQILCPGCTSVFDAEETLRNHLRNHHKMGLKDVKKMVRSLIQIALQNAKLKKHETAEELQPLVPIQQDVKMPEVIEIIPDAAVSNELLPQGVAFISVDELQKMSTPNFEKVDPKEIIQEASINIVCGNEMNRQYMNVNDPSTSNIIQMSSVPPDLISSIQPRLASYIDNNAHTSPQAVATQDSPHTAPKKLKPGRPIGSKSYKTDGSISEIDVEKEHGKLCSTNGCHLRLKDENKLLYHRKCHTNNQLSCPECFTVLPTVELLHIHLWKSHQIDLELPTCEICGYKTYKRHKLFNTHMKIHGVEKNYPCNICSKTFKNNSQLSKHRWLHKTEAEPISCSICLMEFKTQRQMKIHKATVHEKLKPFKCSHCQYATVRSVELKRHLRSHTGDKPYSCEECSYRASDHNAFRRHKKIHSKESLYKCKYCSYSSIQSTTFASHMISKHPNVSSNDLHRCPYCPFKTVNKDKYVVHLKTHPDKEGVQLLLEMTKGTPKNSKPSWTIPSDNTAEDANKTTEPIDEDISSGQTAVKHMPTIEVYDCDSIQDSIPQTYPKNYSTHLSTNLNSFNEQLIVTDFSKDDTNSDCLMSESSNDTLIERQYPPPHLTGAYEAPPTSLHMFTTTAAMGQSVHPSTVSLVTCCSPLITKNIMSNFPIRLPPIPQISVRNNITLKPIDKISLIKPTQILPVPSSSNSPVHIVIEPDGGPRKKPKISVKSNLILKGPDEENMFHSQQKMAFKRLEDNERFGLDGNNLVTFNNLMSTPFMQMPPPPALSQPPDAIILPYTQETRLVLEASTPPADPTLADTAQRFSYQQILPPQPKIQTTDPSYIKLEGTIKQNTQSPSLERMQLNNGAISREYKASPPPPLEEHKNMSEIKNELKSDYYNLPMSTAATNTPLMDQYLLDNIIGEQYAGNLDLASIAMQALAPAERSDVIEIDDNSDDNKLLPRFDMNFPLESLYLMHNDFHFLENEMAANGVEATASEMPRMPADVVPLSQKESADGQESSSGDFPNFIQGKKDPMMNTSVRPSTNKINVKNIELMKN